MTQDNSAGDTQIGRPAPTLWAQRNPVVFLTFQVEGCNNPQVTFEENKVIFTGQDHSKNVKYLNEIEIFDKIKPEGCTWAKKGPGVECTLQKIDTGFWPRLLKDKIKAHWLKTDFNKWVDEDEADEVPEGADDYDLSQMMASMGGAGGMPDMSGLGDDDMDEDDSDDEEIPELEEADDEEAEKEAAA